MDDNKIIDLLIYMIELHSLYKNEIGYSKSELDELVEKYNIINLDCDYEQFKVLYKYGYLNEKEYIGKLKNFLNDYKIDKIEFVEFLEKNKIDGRSIVNYFIKEMKPNNIKKENGNWYFYAEGGWVYFSDYFKISGDYRNDIVELILNGEGYLLFDNNLSDYNIKESYLDVDDENLKYIKTIIQNMKKDYKIEQNDIDEIYKLSDIVSICDEYDLNDLKDGLDASYASAQQRADENEAYEFLINQIIDHFGFTLDSLSWAKGSDKSKYQDTLKIKFKNSDAVKNSIILFYKIENVSYHEDASDYYIDYYSPYYGWNGDAKEYINEEIMEKIPDFVDDKYLS